LASFKGKLSGIRILATERVAPAADRARQRISVKLQNLSKKTRFLCRVVQIALIKKHWENLPQTVFFSIRTAGDRKNHITGSSARKLKKSGVNLLAGGLYIRRCIPLFPLNWEMDSI
jgi:hypothetical protein